MEIIKQNSLNFGNKSFENVPSLIKWTGSKRLQAVEIQSYIPDGFNRYFEPFLGSGSVLYNNTEHQCLVNDIYTPLIELWRNVKQYPQHVVTSYEDDWEKLQENFPDYFYEVRDRFNVNKSGQDLLFLSRTAVNGIIRFNSKGEFNNSIHLSRRGMQPSSFEKIVERWNQKLESVEFFNEDYKDFLKYAEEGDFVYLDPPYVNSRNRYIQNLDTERLFETLEELNNKKIKWALSFDGSRGSENFQYPVPKHLFKRAVLINTGNSKVGQVLNKKQESVYEALYMNYD